VRFRVVSCFPQIETGAKGRACSTQNDYTLVWLLRSNFDRGA